MLYFIIKKVRIFEVFVYNMILVGFFQSECIYILNNLKFDWILEQIYEFGIDVMMRVLKL